MEFNEHKLTEEDKDFIIKLREVAYNYFSKKSSTSIILMKSNGSGLVWNFSR